MEIQYFRVDESSETSGVSSNQRFYAAVVTQQHPKVQVPNVVVLLPPQACEGVCDQKHGLRPWILFALQQFETIYSKSPHETDRNPLWRATYRRDKANIPQ